MRKRYSLWDEMRRMQEQMDSLFDNLFSVDPFSMRNQNLLEAPQGSREIVSSNYKQPICDIYETDKDIIAEVEMPGINKKDIKVNVDKNGIDIKAEVKSEVKHEDKKKGMYRFERNYSGFYRHFALPENVNTDKANAEYKDGVLKITVPKIKIAESKKKQLEIK